jgi:pectinesterase
MSEIGGKARHRRGRRALRVGVPPALTTAVGLAYGTDFGVFGQDARQEAAAAGTAAWTDDVADGFASVDALGQKGTYGGRDGRTVTVRTQADLEKYATAAEPYVIVVAGTIAMNPRARRSRSPPTRRSSAPAPRATSSEAASSSGRASTT